jgi:dipeptidyl aminopeptidase/acylaminoacyl peptidase
MTRRILAAALASAVSLPVVAGAQTAKRPYALDDLGKFKTVADPQISPDGKWIAYTVGSIDSEKDKRDTDVWMVSWDGKQTLQLTSSKASESRPRWSPDGKYLAFTASRADEDEKDEKDEKKKGAQVWLLNRSGGEALKLTDVKGGVDDFEWSPDSTRLVLVVSDPDPSDDPEKIEGWKKKTKPPIVIDRYQFKRDYAGYLQHLRDHLHLFDIATKKAEPLTSGDYDDRNPSWSPDGTQIAFVSKRAPDPDRSHDSNVFVIDAKAGATPRQLTTYPGEDGGRPVWSPDGTTIAYLQSEEAKWYAYDQAKLAVIPAAGGIARLLTESLDRSVGSPDWSADGTHLYFTVEDDRVEYLAKISATGGRIEPLTSGRRVVGSLSLGPNGTMALLSSTAGSPNEVHASEGGTLRKITTHNDAWANEVAFSNIEDVTFTARDGAVVNGLLARPAGAPAGKLPLILWIHGGPNGQDDHSFDNIREILAANGYAVLQVNYRGGSGRGSKYQKAIYADWGNLEVVDLMAGVDWAIKTGVADPNRLGIGGWSYGGILTNYTIATDPRFKAAASGAGSSLQTSMYGADQYILQYDTELGPPWKNPDVWMKVSYPFFKADRIKTPTLFMCGQNDFNVPIVGSEQMYQALKSNGVDAQLIVYPGENHGIAIPSYQRDRLDRYIKWYDKYLKPAVPLPTAAK